MEDDNRQEWIFTLYDFDNSGKVTKEVCDNIATRTDEHTSKYIYSYNIFIGFIFYKFQAPYTCFEIQS